jgi:hypothetical protein
MTGRWPCIVLALLSCLLIAGCREETHEERRLRLWKEDSKWCDKFALERKKARELLAYNPEDQLKPLEEQLAESERRLGSSDERMHGWLLVWEVDVRRCLRGQGWTYESIEELTKKDQARRLKETNERAKSRGR